MNELKINKIQDKEKLDAICQASENCSTQKDPYGYIRTCNYDCPQVPHNQAYKDTRW